MKKSIVLFLSTIVFISCNNEPKADYALFSGTVSNSDAKSLTVIGNGFKKEIEINEGVFSDTLKIQEAGYYTYGIGRESSALHLDKGDDLNLTIDTKEFDESISYSGTGSEKNNLLAKKYLINETVTGEMTDFYSKEESNFIATAKEARMKLEEAINAADVSADFKQQQLDDAKYSFAAAVANYENYHPYFAKKEDFKASEDFKNNMVDVAYDIEESFKSSNAYRNLVSSKYNQDVSAAYDDTKDYGKAIIAVMKDVKNGYIKDELLKDFAYGALSPKESLKETYDFFMENSTNEDYRKAFTEKYNNIKSLVKGSPSPTFEYENYKGGKTALADLKGKYVYIDVWATWCGPCIGEIPSLKLVEKEFHNKNIEFVSISIDTPEAYDKWKAMIADKELGGIQLLADNDWKSKFVTDYGIDGIPRFILIDPNGNIVTADAPRPSNPELKEMLHGLNNI